MNFTYVSNITIIIINIKKSNTKAYTSKLDENYYTSVLDYLLLNNYYCYKCSKVIINDNFCIPSNKMILLNIKIDILLAKSYLNEYFTHFIVFRLYIPWPMLVELNLILL